jgi:hypothetical protein
MLVKTLPMLSSARTSFGKQFFIKVIATAAWFIWNQRNAKQIDNVNPNFNSRSFSFKRDIFLPSYRMTEDLRLALIPTPLPLVNICLLWIKFLLSGPPLQFLVQKDVDFFCFNISKHPS